MRTMVLVLLALASCGSDPTPYDLTDDCSGWVPPDPQIVFTQCARACSQPVINDEKCLYDPTAPANLLPVLEVDRKRGVCDPEPDGIRDHDRVHYVVSFIDCI